MKIAVISDTHIPRAADKLPQKLYNALKDADMILHAGDLTELSVLEDLERIAETRAVYGNMDDHSVRKKLPQKEIINAGKFKIGLTHGSGPPFGIMDRLKKEFGKVDVIVFGHTHSSQNEIKNGVLFFNPGSVTDKVFAKENSYGILEINSSIKGRIVKL